MMNLSIRLHAADDVVIARQQLLSGAMVEGIAVRGLVPPGHKIAVRSIQVGEPVRRYNQIIGFASQAIAPGEHVHTHNLNMGADKGSFKRDHAFGADVKPDAPKRQASFMGYVRPDGRVATRNYIGILSSVNCSATVSRAIADHFSRLTNPSALADFPNVDGVIALTHGTGCGMDGQGLGMQLLTRTLTGYATHPNLAAALVVGLGCESNQINVWLSQSGLEQGRSLQTFNIQDSGGTVMTIAKGIELIKASCLQSNNNSVCLVDSNTSSWVCNAAAPMVTPASAPIQRWALLSICSWHMAELLS
jgi:altronate hydrolase